MKNPLLLLSFVALLSSCNKSPKNDLESTSDTLSYTQESFEKHSQTCVNKDSLCATVKFEYPVFESSKINDIIQSEIINIYHNEDDSTTTRPKTFEDLAKPFVNDYDAKLKEGKEFVKNANKQYEGGFLATPWYMEAYTNVQRQTKRYLMLHTNTNWFMGGAHPISMEYYYIYDRKDFKRIRLEDLFKPDFDKKLLLIAENIFRKQEKLKPTDKLSEDKGYFFEKERFILNDNFTLTETGIKFLYNVYEIKPYAAGITELEIPYSDLKEIMK
jgi:Protein of unknown function (DUF3298)/Deacetylase PdaC